MATAARALVFTASPQNDFWVSKRVRALFSLGHGITLVDPVSAEVVRNVEQLDIAESQGTQFFVCGINVWTFAPRTAPAVNNDGLRARQTLNPLAKTLNTFRLRRRAGVLRIRHVRLLIKDAKSNLEDERPRAFRRLHDFGQFLGLDEFRCGPGGFVGCRFRL